MRTNDTDTRTASGPRIGRRGLLGGATLLAASGATFVAGGGTALAGDPRTDSPLPIIPIPKQVPAKEGYVPVPGGRLWYWDTGGRGTPIILMHPGSGSGEIWPYQQPYFAKAGYRVIGWSMRSKYKSSAADPDNPGTGAEDLHSLVKFLRIDKFHLVGVAYGGGVALDYALLHEEKLLSLSISGSLTSVTNQDYVDMLRRLRPQGFGDMPASFIELGPTYRAINPAGMAAWDAIHDRASHSDVGQPYATKPTWADVERLRVPTLLLWGDGDLYSPPSVQRIMASHFRNVTTVVANECGHAPHWERSDVYNPTLRKFLRRHSR
ncbi:pimeloyl-ACP methyl ester carboxylesterase [Actinomadura pelletieri DSM 43383]|uniref:Pimeloyl-ACP methyl ester carboxylesterase n=1 Tax=Actinomadura pelletieri DSM 43383 TaxID=1120940 RepID=A0A495QTV1_9ACTN|nr:alpha/beta fold hydrolase [Actinomadura pelletieri]RKS76950.1 pimeloyl-ACP methyl ester carboxylesterase [Actinomadura pelletieri DSM 43383]